MFVGAHAIIYSKSPEADRAFLRDIFELSHVDVGGGWLIFGLPPSEVAVHLSGKNNMHELYLMCEDVEAFVARMLKRKVICGRIEDRGWGLLTHLPLPGGGKLGVYQPRHPRPRSRKAAARRPPALRRGPAGRPGGARRAASRRAAKARH
jgi:hypothetical protein